MKHLPGLLVVLPFLFFFALCQLQWKTQATFTEGDILQQTYWVNKQHGPPRNPSDVLVSVHQQRVSISWRNRGTLSPNNDLLIVKNKNFWHTLSCPLIMSSRERIFSPPSLSALVSCSRFTDVWRYRSRFVSDLSRLNAHLAFEWTVFPNLAFYFSLLLQAMLPSVSGSFNQDWLMSLIPHVPLRRMLVELLLPEWAGLVWAEPAGAAGHFLLAADLSLLSVHHRRDPGQLEEPVRQMSNIFFYWSR